MENKINYGEMTNKDIKKEDIVLTEEQDKVFPKNENVNHKKGVRQRKQSQSLEQRNIWAKGY